MALTPEKIADAERDVDDLGLIVNSASDRVNPVGPVGTVTVRSGHHVKVMTSLATTVNSLNAAFAALPNDIAAALLTGENIYADTTAGLAATVDGGFFFVPTANGLELFKDVAGVATTQGVIPTLAAVQAAAARWSAQPVRIGNDAGKNIVAMDNAIAIGLWSAKDALTSDYLIAIGNVAGQTATNSVGATLIGYAAGLALTNGAEAILIGGSAGRALQASAGIVGIGGEAVWNGNDSAYAVVIGFRAGKGLITCPAAVVIGTNAAELTTTSNSLVAIGNFSARELTGSDYAVVVGANAAETVTTSPRSVWIGASAGRYAKNCPDSVFIGASAGYGDIIGPGGIYGTAKDITFGVAIGYAAMRFTNGSNYSIGIGYAAMEDSGGTHNAVGLGIFAGIFAYNSPNAIILGHGAGLNASACNNPILIGFQAGASVVTDSVRGTSLAAVRPVYIGNQAGFSSRNTTDAVLLGTNAASASGLTNVVAIGLNATATVSNQVAIGGPAITTVLLPSGARLQFGGTTAAFPALKRTAATLQVRLADDSGFAPVQGKLTTDAAYGAGAIVPTGYLTLYDSSGTAYRVAAIAA